MKSEHQKNTQEVVIDPNSLPREPFSEESFYKHWEAYQQNLLNKGERIQASILKIAQLHLEGTVIKLEVSTEAAKNEILTMETHLLGYLHRLLRNYDLRLEIDVNEELAKKILITPEEKYSKLLEENPNLQLFRNVFSLSIGR
ncbi:hypothetical protein HMPREF9075_02139 [Capnocytophaga sp. oral taxon 332 str. F0381]|uniref:hypothetical protein n=1 Tax=Capnocytophaga sp. oral taxon 332 TaxID=712213 RepID=UPI0002A3D6DF|nr:hypothetical protein [Capnocytophaga sp. oral taxon 332]EKY07298.1 hypothetical protein HMPREF9075_02139 [Capnocytophaga sp. oral taxon 332 str. F0381]